MRRLYEFSYLIPEDLPKEEVENLEKDINFFITEAKGVLYTPPSSSQDSQNKQVKKKEKEIKKPFYFEKKKGVAYLKTVNFYLDSENIETFKQKIRQKKQILRSILLVKKEPIIKKPSQAKIKPIFPKTAKQPSSAKATIDKEKPKVELKEIDKKLDEILR